MMNFHPELLWVDLEMSGLDPKTNTILEFACILSDRKAQHQEEGPHIIIHCDEGHLKQMDQWNTEHHTQSGLYKACIDSKISMEQAQQQILQFLKNKGVMKGQLCLAGNSVHHDKVFLMNYMPKLHQFLHYRILDVSSIKLVVNAIQPSLFFKKQNSHRALDDIRESIGELQFYMTYAFKK